MPEINGVAVVLCFWGDRHECTEREGVDIEDTAVCEYFGDDYGCDYVECLNPDVIKAALKKAMEEIK